MKLELIVCDICGKTPKNKRIRTIDGMLICSLPCRQEQVTREWTKWRDREDTKQLPPAVVEFKLTKQRRSDL